MKNSKAAAGASTQAALQSANSPEDKIAARAAANAALACEKESDISYDLVKAAFADETKEKVEELLAKAGMVSSNSVKTASAAAKAASVTGMPQWSLLALGASSAAANLESKKNKWKHLLALQENNEELAKQCFARYQKCQKLADSLELQFLTTSAFQQLESDDSD